MRRCLYNWMCIFPDIKMIWTLSRRPPYSFYLRLTSDIGFCSYTAGGGWDPRAVSPSVLSNARQIIRLSLKGANVFSGIRHQSVSPAGRFYTPLAPAHLSLLCSSLHEWPQWHSGLDAIPQLQRHLACTREERSEPCAEDCDFSTYFFFFFFFNIRV